jgi:hypothetical protein
VRRGLVLLAAAAALAVGCGGDDEGAATNPDAVKAEAVTVPKAGIKNLAAAVEASGC